MMFGRVLDSLFGFRLRLLAAACVACVGWISVSDQTDAQDSEMPFDWAESEELASGVRYTTLEHEYPNADGLTCPNYLFFVAQRSRKLKLYALRIDSQTPGLKFVVTGRAENWGQPMPDFRDQVLNEFTIRTKRQTTREFLDEQRQRGLSLLVATNAAPWSPFQSGVTHPFADKMGLTISNGELVCPSDGRPSLLVMKDGQLDLRIVDSQTDLESIETAVSGFSFCLTDGKLGEVDTVLHPRTGFGLCREKRFLIILIVDGRQASSQGTTVRELGGWLRFFGAHHGLNMDGGGSTTLVQWNESGQRSEVINRPAHGERANGNNLGIYFLTESP